MTCEDVVYLFIFFLSHCHSVNKSSINLLMLKFIFISFVECVHLWLIYCAEIRFFFNSVPLITWAGQHIEQCVIRNFETLMMSCVTSQRERFMNALKPYKLLVFYNHVVPEKCFFLLYRDRGRCYMFPSLLFSSSFVPLCVQYDYQNTVFHLFINTACMYYSLVHQLELHLPHIGGRRTGRILRPGMMVLKVPEDSHPLQLKDSMSLNL